MMLEKTFGIAVRPLVLLSLMLLPVCFTRAGEPSTGEELLPANSLLTIVVPDLQSARTQFEKTRMAEIFAQSVMQEFFKPIFDEIKKQEAETLKANPTAFSFNAKLFDGGLAAAFFATPNEVEEGGIVAIFTPKAPADFLKALPPSLAKMLQENKIAENLPPGSEFAIAWANDRLIMASPAQHLKLFTAAKPGAGIAQSPGYIKVKQKLSGAIAWMYGLPQTIYSIVTEEVNPKEAAQYKVVLSLLGLDKIDAAGVSFAFKNGDLVAEAFGSLNAPNAQPGIMSLMMAPEAKPLPPDVVKIAAVDAPYITSGYFNFAGILPLVKRQLALVQPKAAAQLDGQLQAVTQMLQFDIQKDVFENIDGQYIAAQTPSNTALPIVMIPGIVYSFGAKNPAKLEECLGKVEALLGALPEPVRGKVKLKKIVHETQNIFYLSAPIIPLSPAISVVNGRLLLGTSLNAMRRTLDQLKKKDSILDNKDFQQAMARATGQPFGADKLPVSFTYGLDEGSGNGALLMAGSYILAAGGLQVLNASLPVPPGVNLEADMKANESAAAQNVMGFAEAQEIYHRTDYDKDGVLEYAQTMKGNNSLFESEAGKKDLQLIAEEMSEASDPDGKKPYHGYRFKVLTGKINENGDKMSFVVNGNMTLGYAVLAYPAQYGFTGKRTFSISSNGTVYAVDWGQQTADKVKAATIFDPTGWQEHDEFMELAGTKDRSEVVAMNLLRQVDLGLWPDQAFFNQYRKPTVATFNVDANSMFWRTEMPPPMPEMPRMDSAPVIVAVVAIGAGLTLPVLARARESARRTSSASNLNQIAKAAYMYADVPANGDFPAHPKVLFPKYVADPRVFQNPRFPDQDVGFTWVSGVSINMATAVVAFENPPEGDQSGGRNVLIAAGTVEFMEDAQFQEMLAQTEAEIKKAGKQMKLIPISMKEIIGEAGGGDNKAKPPPEF